MVFVGSPGAGTVTNAVPIPRSCVLSSRPKCRLCCLSIRLYGKESAYLPTCVNLASIQTYRGETGPNGGPRVLY